MAWDSFTIMMGSFGLISALVVLVLGVKSDSRPAFRSCCYKRGLDRDQ